MWKVLNSGIFIWLLSTAVGVFGAFALKHAIEVDIRVAQLQNEAAQIDLEIEGRLAQFSSWMVGVVVRDDLDGESWTYRFRDCVTPFYLSRSVRSFGDPPNTFGKSENRAESYGFADTDCSTLPIIRSIFKDYAATALSGLFAQRVIIEQDLIDAIEADIWVDKVLLAERRGILERHGRAWKDSMSPLLDPTAPAGFGLQPDRPVNYPDFADRMQSLFYLERGGPEIFYYGDCFMC